MPDIRFTLFDSDNFYQQGLRLLLQDYLHSLNECQRLYPQFSPLALQALDNIEIVFRTPEERWGCACCYRSPYGIPRQRQLTLLILDDTAQQQVKNLSPLFRIARRDCGLRDWPQGADGAGKIHSAALDGAARRRHIEMPGLPPRRSCATVGRRCWA
ncbi:hypothetical protein [Serratia marcescens]|uniref:hypothetical protein n=1 Tax=Serratia marcescens TaxID=615 RepID=UPI00355B20BD